MYITLDSIVKSALLNKGYPLHWYFRFLNYGANCVQELGFNTLKNINTRLLTVDQFGQCILPTDYVDFVKVGLQRGQFVKPLTQTDSYNRITNIDNDGNQQRRGFGCDGIYGYYGEGIGIGWNTGYYGGWYGAVNDQLVANHYANDGFKIIKEQGEFGIIQLAEYRSGQKIVLEYISNTSCADLMTRINPQAKFAIIAYIDWQMKANNRNSGSGEIAMAKDEWITKWRNLRSYLSDLTCDDIIRSFRKEYTSTPKG